MSDSHKLLNQAPETQAQANGLAEAARALPPSYPSVGAYGSYFDASGPGKMHLRDYWRKVRKRLWLVIGVCLIGTTFAAVQAARKPDIYAARARVQVDLENNSPAAGGPGGATGLVVVSNATNDPAYFNTQLQILKGEALQRRVVKTLDLAHNTAFLRPEGQQRTVWENLLRMFGVGARGDGQGKKKTVPRDLPLAESVAPASARDDLVEAEELAPYVGMLKGGLVIEPVRETSLPNKETRLIEVSFAHADPQVAAKVANAVVDTFTLSNLERRVASNSNTGEFLQKRIAELQSQIRNGEERLINYARDNQILSLDAGQNTVVDRLVGLNKQLLEAENERKLAEAAYRAAQAPGAAEAQAEPDAKQANEARGKIAELQQKRAQLLVEYTESYPEVKEIDQQLAVLQRQVAETQARATQVMKTNLDTRYRQALAREQSIRDAFDQQRGSTLSQNAAAINYRIIQQEIETNKGMLNDLLQQAKENDVVRAGRPNNIYVAEYATTPKGPVGPRRLMNVGMAFVMLLGLGVALAIFFDYLDDSVSSIEDVGDALKLSTMAVIPRIGAHSRRRLRGGAERPSEGGGELLPCIEPRSMVAESYRQLRTSIILSTAGGPPKTILVTSSLPSEGKTTTAANIAICLAQTGAPVLLVDADMRRPRVHALLGAENGRGLSNILSSGEKGGGAAELIKKHDETGVFFLTSGSIPPNPAELLGSEQMRRFLEEAGETFKFVILDSPPVATCTDGVILSTMSDGVVLVVRGGKSPREVVTRAKQILTEVRAKLLGVVLNNVKAGSDGYYRHYRGYYNAPYAEKPKASLSTGIFN